MAVLCILGWIVVFLDLSTVLHDNTHFLCLCCLSVCVRERSLLSWLISTFEGQVKVRKIITRVNLF